MKRPSDVMRALALLALLALEGAAWAQDEPVTARTPREAVSQEKEAVTSELDTFRMAVEDAEQNQYTLLKKAERLINATGTRVNGLGRVLWMDSQSYGPGMGLPRGERGFDALLDLDINGTVSREIKWSGLFRLRSDLMPTLSSNSFTMQRIHLNLNPAWFSAVVGDFEESYTPFTLWNRDAHDFVWEPTFSKRPWDIAKHERFVGKEPDLPFRGLKVGTSVMWPDSPVMDRFAVSCFGHYARNAFQSTGSYVGRSVLLGGASVEASVKQGLSIRACGLLYDQPDWSRPGEVYDYSDPATWARSYRVGSVGSKIERRVWRKIHAGAEGEAAFATQESDKREIYRNTSDYAFMGGPFVRFGAGKIQFNVLDVGNDYGSPLAQTRQKDARTGALLSMPVLSQLPAPGGQFAWYSRLEDNVFPYGLSTPNRQGLGAEFDLHFLKKSALKLKGSAYGVREITGNYVVTPDWKAVTPVDAPLSPTNPLRDFLYVNAAPRVDLAVLAGTKRDLELCFNVRVESTKSDLFGKLDSRSLSGGIRAEILPGWRLEPAVMLLTAKGREAMAGGEYARTPYRFDNQDLGSYAATDVDVKATVLGLSTTVEAGANAKFLLDGSNRKSEDLLGNQVRNDNSVNVGYEVVF